MQEIVVTQNLWLMPMIVVALIILGVIFLLAGGAHLLGPLLHHFGLVAIGLIAVMLLIFVLRTGSVSSRSNQVAMIDGAGGSAMVSTGGGSADVAWVGWVKLGLIAALAIGGIAALAHSGIFTHPHVLGVGGAILAVVLGLALLGFFIVPSQHVKTPATPQPTPDIPEIALHTDLLRYQKDVRNDGRHTPTAVDSTIPVESADNAQPKADTTSTDDLKQSDTAKADLPAWVEEPPHWKDAGGRTFVIVVRSGLVTDPNLLEEQLDNKMVARTNQYIEEQVLRRTGASDVVGFDADYLREHCVRQRYPTDGKTAGAREMFAQLEFDRQFRDEVNRRYTQFLGQERLQQTGGVAAAAFAVLGGLYLFLRTTSKKKDSGFGVQGPGHQAM
jgi:hypothetical protein